MQSDCHCFSKGGKRTDFIAFNFSNLALTLACWSQPLKVIALIIFANVAAVGQPLAHKTGVVGAGKESVHAGTLFMPGSLCPFLFGKVRLLFLWERCSAKVNRPNYTYNVTTVKATIWFLPSGDFWARHPLDG